MTMKIFVYPLLFAALFAVGSCDLPGGLSDIDTNSLEFRQAMNFAVDEYNSNTTDNHYHKVIGVLRAQSQVVEGENIYMTLILARSRCSKTDLFRKFCPIYLYPRQLFQCSFEVSIALETGEMTLTSDDCS